MKSLIAAAALGSAVMLTASAASAEIACNREGECWHVKEVRVYRPEHGIIVHPEGWRWAEHEREKYRWREHEGRGYWHEGRWVEIR